MSRRKPVYVLMTNVDYEPGNFHGVYSSIPKVHFYITQQNPVGWGSEWSLHRCEVDGLDREIWTWAKQKKPKLTDMPDELLL